MLLQGKVGGQIFIYTFTKKVSTFHCQRSNSSGSNTSSPMGDRDRRDGEGQSRLISDLLSVPQGTLCPPPSGPHSTCRECQLRPSGCSTGHTVPAALGATRHKQGTWHTLAGPDLQQLLAAFSLIMKSIQNRIFSKSIVKTWLTFVTETLLFFC